MPATPQIQAALDELRRRGINIGDNQPVAQNLPATPSSVTPDDLQVQYASAPAPMQATGAQPAPDYSSPRDAERQLKLKKMKGELAIQDAVNELKRRGVNLQLRTAPAAEEVIERGVQEQVESARKQGDPEAFKSAWRTLFPGKPLPRKPDGQIDYEGGQDDIDVEVDRKKKLEAAKTGLHNVTETKVTRTNPTTGKEEEYLVRVDKLTGQKLGETLISESAKGLNKEQSDAKTFSSRMRSNNQTILGIEAKGFEPSAIGTTMQRFLPNRFRSEDVQAYNAAKQNWIAAVLRRESGAAISAKEYADADKQYFAQDGDSPSVVKQKQALREQSEQQLRDAIGPHGAAYGGAAGTPTQSGAAAAPAAPAAPTEPVRVNSAAEAPPTAKFIRSPSGRTYRNPKYTGP